MPGGAREWSGLFAGEERAWLLVMAAIALVELIWWAIAWGLGIAPLIRLPIYFVIAFAALGAAAVLRMAMGHRPSAAPLPAVVAGTVLIAVGAAAFLPLKYAIPHEIPFWLDRPAAFAERSLFGTDPWLLLDRLFGWWAVPLDWLYAAWLPTQLLMLFLLMLAAPSRVKSRALIAYALIWFVLGAVGAVLLSSAGPIFYDRLYGGNLFAGLRQTLDARGAWLVTAESDAMWASLVGAKPGMVAGISAFPSIHVAISFWLVLAARSLAPRFTPLAIVYFLLILIGSVQLGWHYASDGLVAVVGALGLWRLAGQVADKQKADPFGPASLHPVV